MSTERSPEINSLESKLDYVPKKPVLTAEFANEVRDVLNHLPEDLPLGSLLLWNESTYKQAMYKAKFYSKKFDPYGINIRIINELPPTPPLWLNFVESLSRGQKASLFGAIGRAGFRGEYSVTLKELSQFESELNQKSHINKFHVFVALAFKRSSEKESSSK